MVPHEFRSQGQVSAVDNARAQPRELIFLAPVSGPIFSGSERVLIQLSSIAHRAPDLDVFVLVLGPGRFSDELRARGIPFATVTESSKYSKANGRCRLAGLWLYLRAALQLISERPNAILHSGGRDAHVVAAAVNRFTGTPYILHFHDMPRFPLLYRSLGKRAKAIISVSWAVAAHHRLSRLKVPQQVMHNAVGTVGLELSNRSRVDCFPMIGLFGQLVEWKGHETAIRSLALLKEYDLARLYIYGDEWDRRGLYREKLGRLARELGVDDKVVFAGYVEDVFPAIAVCDVVVVPSFAEPFGLVALEAMAVGKPVVASDSGGLREIVEHGVTGMLFPEGSFYALAEAVRAVVRDESRMTDLGEQGRKRACRLFSEARLEEQFLGVVNACLSVEPGADVDA